MTTADKSLDIMKNISNYLVAACLLFGASCSQTQEGSYYVPNKDDSKEIHFIQSSVEKEFAQGSETGIIDVEIARTGDKGSYKVFLAKKGSDEKLFTVPAEVTIPDGKHSVTVPVEVNLRGGSAGSNFKTTLYISDREVATGDNAAQISQYADKMNLSASFELEWETLYRTDLSGEKVPQLATYHYALYYSGRDTGLEVEKAIGARIYRVKDWASGVAFKFIVHDDNTCTVPAQSIGYFHTTYNEYVYVADMAVYLGDDAAYAQYPCTYDGKNTYTFTLIYYISAGTFAQGVERLVFETDPDTTPVVNIEYLGLESTTTGFFAPKLAFTPNEYARTYKAAIVAGDLTVDAYEQEVVRQQIIDEKLQAVTPIVTRSEADESVWNVPKGNYTAVALAYDSLSNPCKLYTRRFTCDPNEEYAPRAIEFDFYAPVDNINYSPYNTLVWQMQTDNVARMKYLCVNADVINYLCEQNNTTPEELTAAQGNEISEEIIEQLNSPEGRGTVFTPLDEGCTYFLGLLMYNAFGDTKFVSKTATTAGFFAKDFDRTKSLSDFIGSFSATADVYNGTNTVKSTFRVDITRINDRDVMIDGLSDMRDFTPRLKGYYDEDLHMIVIDTQSAGTYGDAYASLGYSDVLFVYWGSESMALGYIGDKLYMAASPYSKHEVRKYMFMLFSQPDATSATYLRKYVGQKQYSALKMTPLTRSSAQPSEQPVVMRTVPIEAAGQTFPSYLPVETALRPTASVARPAAPAPQAQAEGKRIRSDLPLRAN